jgi:hypothetical protein
MEHGMRLASIKLIAILLATSSHSMLWAQHGHSDQIASSDAMWGYQSPATYKILPRPATHATKESPHINVPPRTQLESKKTQPYAYGWFGTKPSPQWSRQFGTRSAFTQWTLK